MEGLEAEDATDIEYHIKTDRCQRCLALTKSGWFQGLVKLVKSGQAAREALEAMREPSVSPLGVLPSAAGVFGKATRAPFQLYDSDKLLTITACETDESRFEVHVDTGDTSLAGRVVQVELLGDAEPLSAVVVLKPVADQGCSGQEDLGSFGEVISRLGSRCRLLWALTDQRREVSEGPGAE